MKKQLLNLSFICNERTLRSDFGYHHYFSRKEKDCYKFCDLFDFVNNDKVPVNGLYRSFQYCEIGDVDNNGDAYPVVLNFSERNLLDEDYYKKIENGDIISVDLNDILISKVRPHLKKFVRITSDTKSIYFTSAFIHIKAKKIPEIMYYCFRGVFFDSLLAISRRGKGYPTLSEEDLFHLQFSRPIVDKLLKNSKFIISRIQKKETKIANLKKKILDDSTIINNVFQKEFCFDYKGFRKKQSKKFYNCSLAKFSNNQDLRFSAKFHREAGAFVLQQLTDITNKKIKTFLAEPIVLGASISPDDFSENGDYKYISMASIKNWRFDTDSANTVSESYSHSKLDKSVRKNDIILARSGEGTIGKVAFIDFDCLGIFCDFTMRIRLTNYNPEFAYYYFRTSFFQYLIEIYKKGLGNNTNIFPSNIQDLPMIDVSLKKQKQIVNEIKKEVSKQDKIKNQIKVLRLEIDKIINNAIRGK